MATKKGFTLEEAEKAATKLGLDFASVQFDAEQFRKGMDVELEHGRRDADTNVTNDDPLLTGKIAWAHLKERPDYYDALARYVESGGGEEDPSFIRMTTSSIGRSSTMPGDEDTMVPTHVRVAGQLYELVREEPEDEAPDYIKVAGVLFERIGKKGGKKKSKGKGKWGKLPKGWTKKSAESFWESVGGSVTKCRAKVKDAPEISDTGSFCASLKDLIEGPEWRSEPRKKKSKDKGKSEKAKGGKKGGKKKSKKSASAEERPKFIRVNGHIYELDE